MRKDRRKKSLETKQVTGTCKSNSPRTTRKRRNQELKDCNRVIVIEDDSSGDDIIECKTALISKPPDIILVKNLTAMSDCISEENKSTKDGISEQLNQAKRTRQRFPVLNEELKEDCVTDLTAMQDCINEEKKSPQDGISEQLNQVKRTRRRFPVLNEEAKEDGVTDETYKIYTSQIVRFKEKKEKFEVAMKDLLSVLADEDSSSDGPIVLPEKMVEVQAESNTASPNSKFRNLRSSVVDSKGTAELPKPPKVLYSNLDKLFSEHKENRCELENSLVEDVDLYVSPSYTLPVEKFLVNIKWKTKIFSFRLESNMEFSKLLPELSSKLDVPNSRILLFLNEELLNHSKTPAEVNFKSGTVIECFVSSEETPASCESSDTIEVKVQSNIDRQKVTIKCSKVEPLEKVLEQYAALKNVKSEQLCMKLDGESVDLNETPDELGLEDGDCIDIVFQS